MKSHIELLFLAMEKQFMVFFPSLHWPEWKKRKKKGIIYNYDNESLINLIQSYSIWEQVFFVFYHIIYSLVCKPFVWIFKEKKNSFLVSCLKVFLLCIFTGSKNSYLTLTKKISSSNILVNCQGLILWHESFLCTSNHSCYFEISEHWDSKKTVEWKVRRICFNHKRWQLMNWNQ